MTDKLFLIDSNILVYAYDVSEGEKFRVCSSLIESCWKKDRKFAVSVQNLLEFYIITTSKIEFLLDKEIAKEIVKKIIAFDNFIKIGIDKETISSAIDLSIEHNIHYWDALLIATMKRNHIYGIYTENKNDFEKVKFLEVINPIEECKNGFCAV